MNELWDYRFLGLAKHISDWSKDPSTQVGAVITNGKRIVSLGFNGFPAGVLDYSERYDDRDMKYLLTLHAEENALLFAKHDLTGCTIYTWPFPPCCNCSMKIIQTGITRVVSPPLPEELKLRWNSNIKMAQVFLREAGVDVTILSNERN